MDVELRESEKFGYLSEAWELPRMQKSMGQLVRGY